MEMMETYERVLPPGYERTLRDAVVDHGYLLTDCPLVAESPAMSRRHTFPLQPNRKQQSALDACLEATCQLCNATLEEGREAWRTARCRVTFYSQDAQLKEIRAGDPARCGRWPYTCERYVTEILMSLCGRAAANRAARAVEAITGAER